MTDDVWRDKVPASCPWHSKLFYSVQKCKLVDLSQGAWVFFDSLKEQFLRLYKSLRAEVVPGIYFFGFDLLSFFRFAEQHAAEPNSSISWTEGVKAINNQSPGSGLDCRERPSFL